MSKKTAFLVVAVGFVVLVGVIIASFIRVRTTPAMNACVNNLRQLDAAKESWRLENHKTTKDTPTWAELLPYLREKPVCPQGGTYLLGQVGEPPRCSLGGTHTLPQ